MVDETKLQNTANLCELVLYKHIPFQVIKLQELEQILKSPFSGSFHLIGIPLNIALPEKDNTDSEILKNFLLNVIESLAKEAELELACNNYHNGTINNKEIAICPEELEALVNFFRLESEYEEENKNATGVFFGFSEKEFPLAVSLDEPDFISLAVQQGFNWNTSGPVVQSYETGSNIYRLIPLSSDFFCPESKGNNFFKSIIYGKRYEVLIRLQDKFEAGFDWKNDMDFILLRKWIFLLFNLSSATGKQSELFEFLNEDEFSRELVLEMFHMWMQLIFDSNVEAMLKNMVSSLEFEPVLNFTVKLNIEIQVTNGPKHYAGNNGLVKFKNYFNPENYQLIVCAALPFLYRSTRFEAADIANYFLLPSIKIIKKVGRFSLFECQGFFILHAALEDDAPRIFSEKVARSRHDFNQVSLFLSDEELQFLILVVGKIRVKNKIERIHVHCREGWNRSHFMAGLICFIENLYQNEINLELNYADNFLQKLRQKAEQHVFHPLTTNEEKYKINKSQFVSFPWEKQLKISLQKIYELFENASKVDDIDTNDSSQKWHQLALILQQQLDKIFNEHSAFMNFIADVFVYREFYILELLSIQVANLPVISLLVRYMQLSNWMQRITMPPPRTLQGKIQFDEIDKVIAEILSNPLHENIHAAVRQIVKSKLNLADKLIGTGMGINLAKFPGDVSNITFAAKTEDAQLKFSV